jgi:hypothetical protein
VSRGLLAPCPTEKHHRARFGTIMLRWEQRTRRVGYIAIPQLSSILRKTRSACDRREPFHRVLGIDLGLRL